MPPPRVLAFAGSARRDSLNRKFLAVAASMIREAGATVDVLDLNEYALPLYNGDLDMAGLPVNAKKLIALIASHEGLLIASPEYNSMITPLLKNTVDWCTRDDTINPFEDRVTAVISASPGAYGGVRSLQMAQSLLLKVGCRIVPGQCALPHADQAFGPDGALVDARAAKSLKTLTNALVVAMRR